MTAGVGSFAQAEDLMTRSMPSDVAAERGVIGGMLRPESDEVIPEIIKLVRARDFYRPAHQIIFECILGLTGRGELVDMVTVIAALTKAGTIAQCGGPMYVYECMESVVVAEYAVSYAKIVKEKATLRRLVETGTRIAQFGNGADGEDADDLVARAQVEMDGIGDARGGEDYARLSDILPEALDEVDAIGRHGDGMLGVPTGFVDLDKLTNGLHPGQVIIVAARPALGKSTLALDFARSAAIKHGLTTAFFSLEMARNEIMMRLFSAEARIPLHNIRAGMMGDDDWTKLSRRMPEISEAPLFIDDSANMSMMDIRAKCRRLKQQNGLRLVIVDYMQLMTSPQRTESRQNEVSEISRALKLMAKELEVPVVALSQLNRGPEQRTDKKPALSDLRESGSIEQDSDVVILLNREDAYEKETARAGEADLIVAKHRNGPTTTVVVAFQGHYSRFVDMTRSG